MRFHSQWIGAAALAAAVLLAPDLAAAQAGINGAAAANGNAFGRGMSNDFGIGNRPAVDPALAYREGVDDLQAGRFREAEEEFNASLSGDPKNANTLFMLGAARSGRGDLRGAVRAYEKSLKIDDKPVAVHREYALALAKLGQSDKAQAQLAILKARSDACASTCPEARDLSTAVTAVQTALAAPTGPAAPGRS